MSTNGLSIQSAMILAAGLGTRMRPLTLTTPKPLIKVAGKALIDYILDAARQDGVTQAVVNVHYLADQMEAHLARLKTPRIIISDERAAILDSGGGVLKALPHLGRDPFYIFNADAFWTEGETPALARLRAAFDPDRMDILLLLADANRATGWGRNGDFARATDGKLRRLQAGEISPHVYAGAGIWKPELFAGRPEIFSLNLLFNEAIARGRLFGLALERHWMHVGTPEAIAEAEEALRHN
jgi:N-acetyl-alpha-D-muramate 1-phosphate uridylyltransferase